MKTSWASASGLVTFVTSTVLTFCPQGYDGCGQGPQAGVWATGQEVGAPGRLENEVV